MAYCLWEQYFHNAAYDMDTGKMLLTQLSNKNTEEVVLPTQGETKAFPCFDYFSNNLQTFLFCLIFSLIRKIDFFFFLRIHDPLRTGCPQGTVLESIILNGTWENFILFLPFWIWKFLTQCRAVEIWLVVVGIHSGLVKFHAWFREGNIDSDQGYNEMPYQWNLGNASNFLSRIIRCDKFSR